MAAAGLHVAVAGLRMNLGVAGPAPLGRARLPAEHRVWGRWVWGSLAAVWGHCPGTWGHPVGLQFPEQRPTSRSWRPPSRCCGRWTGCSGRPWRS